MKNLFHGECVALGMIPMCSKEVRKRLINVLNTLNLPTKLDINHDVIINAMRHDKKMAGDKITVIYVEKVGSFELRDMPFDLLDEKIIDDRMNSFHNEKNC